jgi:hypothetical protein
MQRYNVLLHCLHCQREQPHVATYLGNVVASISCSRCPTAFRTPPELLRKQYLRDFELRLARKPGKMLHHAKKHPVEFLFHYMPRGLVHKPAEVFREWGALNRIISTAGADDHKYAASA